MAATEGNPSFALMLTDQLQDSPRERSAPARELKRMKFSEVPEDFDNIVLQNQQLIMAATEAAKSAAYTVNHLSEMLKAVLPASVPQGERADPDPTPVGRPPPAPPPSTTPSQPGEQRELVRTDQMTEKAIEDHGTNGSEFLQTTPTHASRKGKIGTSDGKSEVFERKPFTLSVRMQTFLELQSRGPNWTKRGNMQAKLTTRGKSLSRKF